MPTNHRLCTGSRCTHGESFVSIQKVGWQSLCEYCLLEDQYNLLEILKEMKQVKKQKQGERKEEEKEEKQRERLMKKI